MSRSEGRRPAGEPRRRPESSEQGVARRADDDVAVGRRVGLERCGGADRRAHPTRDLTGEQVGGSRGRRAGSCAMSLIEMTICRPVSLAPRSAARTPNAAHSPVTWSRRLPGRRAGGRSGRRSGSSCRSRPAPAGRSPAGPAPPGRTPRCSRGRSRVHLWHCSAADAEAGPPCPGAGSARPRPRHFSSGSSTGRAYGMAQVQPQIALVAVHRGEHRADAAGSRAEACGSCRPAGPRP